MRDKLKQALEELQNELTQMGSHEPKLQKLADDVQVALKESAADVPLVDSLRDAAEAFEAHHPQLTALINNVMTSLSNIGI
ncbi:MAG: DUF4404 family protein [Verrucomicrobia bacterium]|nr:DUF4404 family protein [Verrucomicrobiota bacterium]